MTKYLQVKSKMDKLNNAYRYNEIELKPRESRIMLEILKFHPQFEKKWTKGCKFVYANSKNDQGVMYNDIFIKWNRIITCFYKWLVYFSASY